MKKKILFISIIFVVFITISILSYFIFREVEPKKNKLKEVKTLSKIDNYDIVLSENDTELFKSEFEILKNNLDSKEVNYDEYAKSIAKLFIIDLYTIDNKINKYDVGGTEFIYPKNVKNYKENVTDTIYKYIEDNSENKRKQNLPVVSSIEVKSVKKDKFTIKDDKTYPSYVFKINWDYKVNLAYDKEGTITVINDNNKMYVVQKD